MRRPTLAPLLCSLILLTACASGEQLGPHRPSPTQFRPSPTARTTPRTTDTAPLLHAWRRAGDAALASALPVGPAFREALWLAGDEAVAYDVQLAEGQQVEVSLERGFGASQASLELFDARGRARLLALEAPGAASFRAPAGGRYVLRLQPEPGGGGSYVVAMHGDGGIAFPIPGYDASAIQSGYGDARDGGARQHEGVDIFAPRGAPVIAVADGYVTDVRSTPQGGRVIWVRDADREFTYYYAHLEERLVEQGVRISAGDTIGRVGNSGNAGHASPHLHFAIYRPGTIPVDPTHLLEGAALEGGAPEGLALVGNRAHTRGRRVRLRSRPSTESQVIAELEEGTPLRVLGALRDWHRVRLEDGRTGFVAGRLLQITTTATH